MKWVAAAILVWIIAGLASVASASSWLILAIPTTAKWVGSVLASFGNLVDISQSAARLEHDTAARDPEGATRHWIVDCEKAISLPEEQYASLG